MNEQPLKIVSASAGSGKTFSLVRNYLLLLFRSERPYPFSNIVAMTFTNLAALEMKLRIVEAMFQLAFPDRAQKTSDHKDFLCNELKWKEDKLQQKAKEQFLNLLHRYEEFAITTIDKFNLRLIRSFSRELDLPPEFEVVIETDSELNRLLDTILSDLGDPNNETLNELALGFSEAQLQEGKKWDFVKGLKNSYSVLTDETHQDSIALIDQNQYDSQKFFTTYQAKKKQEKLLDTLLEETSRELLALAGDPSQLIGKSGMISAFSVESLKKNLVTSNSMLTAFREKSLREGNKSNDPRPDLLSIIENAQEEARKLNDEIKRLDALCKSHHPMAFMQVLHRRLEKHRVEEQILLISEFNSLLSALIQDEEAPFIYERIGTKVDHFLLDEFQDTSRLQWLNLIPLVDESLANGRTCFIVGDPKQSIYRFKNGLPEQFVALPGIYNPEGNPKIEARSRRFIEKSDGKSNLPNNYRSNETIIEINNQFFSDVVRENPQWQLEAYADVVQKPIKSKAGYLEFYFNSERIENDEDIIDMLEDWIKDALAAGFKANDIAILGFKNKECSEWAKKLTMRGYQLISAEALKVDADFAVRYAIAYLKFRAHPGAASARKNMVAMTLRHFSLPSEKLSEFEAEKGVSAEELFLYSVIEKSKLLQHFTSIYDAINSFAKAVDIDPLENYYYSHLLDLAHDFDMNHGPDLDRFLQEYEEHKKKSSVMLPESSESIQILTIHKSKGLEFPVVLLPKLAMQPSMPSQRKYFFELENEIVNITLSEAKKIAELAPLAEQIEQTEEKDHLNKLYVGMTRAVERQYIYFLNSGKSKSIKEDSPYYSALLNLSNSAVSLEDNHFALGEKLPADLHQKESDADIFNPKAIGDHLWFPDIALKEERLKEDEPSLSDERRYGTQLHDLLSKIQSEEDVKKEISNGLTDGIYEVEFAAKLERDAREILNKVLQPIFSSASEIWREQDLFDPNTKERHRPDLIYKDQNGALTVLDFKSGQIRERDKKQVQQYAKILQEAFEAPVTSGLIYTDEEEIVMV